MNNVEIYISDQLVDLAEDTTIERTYTSPLFGDLESIANAVTNNITLPMSPRNRAIFGFAERLDMEAVETPFKRLPAKMYINGTPVFDNGYAQLTEVNESGYSVVLTWGAIDNFEQLIESKMTDLGPALEGIGVTSIAWNENSPTRIHDLAADVDFLTVNYGMGINDPQYLRPAIDVDTVLWAIEEAHGITIPNRKGLATTSDGRPLYLPLVERNGDSETLALLWKKARTIPYTPGFLETSPKEEYLIDFARIYQGPEINVSEVNTIHIRIGRNPELDDRATIEWCIDVGNEIIDVNLFSFEILGAQRYGKYLSYYDVLYTQDSSLRSEKRFYFDPIEIDIDVNNYQIIVFRVFERDRYNYSGIMPVLIYWNLTINGEFKDKKIIYPYVNYPIAPNLPDMSQGEFLQSLMMMKGLFPYTDAKYPNEIRTMSLGRLYRNMDPEEELYVYDWSNKLQAPDRISNMADADAVAFEVGDYAQRNILDYENDDDVSYNTEGVISCDSVFLDKKNENKVPFSASMNAVSEDTNGITALIPIYELDDNGKDVNENSVSSRIVAAVQVEEIKSDGTTQNIYVGQFLQSQFFGGKSGIVATYYNELQQVVKRPRVITVELHLTNVDLWNLDYTKPVYFDRFGGFFAIEQLIVDGNNMVTAKLVALPALQATAGNAVVEQQTNE